MTNEKHCKNCDALLEGQFCHKCGQRDVPSGITMKEVVRDFISYSFSIEGPFVRTIRMLAVNPGMLFRDFISGVRANYYKPIQFFLVATFFYLILAKATGFDPLEGQFENEQDFESNERMVKLFSVSKLAARFMVENINNFLFILAFSLATFMKFFHWRMNTFAEYLVIGFYSTGVYILLTMSDLLLALFDLNFTQSKFILLIGYFTYAYSSFLGGFTLWRTLRGSLIAFLSLLLYISLAWSISVCVILIRT